MRSKPLKSPVHVEAFKIAVIYFALGIAWISTSDIVTEYLVPTRQVALLLNMLKGWIYILLTASLTYVLVGRLLRQRQRRYHELVETEARYLGQRNGLLALANLRVVRPEDLAPVLQQITEISARTLGVARASIWLYGPQHTRLECSDLYEIATGRHTNSMTLDAQQYPEYFLALSTSDVIDADHAATDQRTGPLTEFFLSGLGVSSKIDACVRLGGRLEGVLCHEHVGPPRHWTPDEKNFVVAAANQVALALEGWHRARAEEHLDSTQEMLQRAVSAAHVGLWEWDLRTNQFHFTAEAKQQIGYADDEIGNDMREWEALLHPEERERVVEYLLQYASNPVGRYSQEFRLRHKDGSYRWLLSQGACELDEEGKPIRMLASRTDITERKQLEEEFSQAQKMECVGRLAGGVAHDFNNLLTVMMGYCELVLDELDPSDPMYEQLVEISQAGTRAAALTRQLLAFSRRQVLQPEVLSLNDTVRRTESLLRRLIGEDIELVTNLGEGIGNVKADPGQIEQVVMNLAVNARDAMPDGGRLTICTGEMEVLEGQRSRHPDLSPGRYVCIGVSDTGVGMDEETISKIFEPFFTTKDANKGTGLGLATVYGIVTQSGGAVEVESTPGKGSTFRVCLPRVEASIEQQQAAATAQAGGRETILVVEDQEAVRQLVHRFLTNSGYHVLTAADAAEACAIVESTNERIHLLLADVVMPGASGPELARQLCEKYPDLRVLYMSGYTDPPVIALAKDAPLIMKPFTSAQLGQRLREVLEA